MLNPIHRTEKTLVQNTCIQTFDFCANPPQCGKPAAFLIKSIYTPEYSIMCDECKKDFFENVAFQTIAQEYRAYFYSEELNKRFAEELKQELGNTR